MHETFMQFNTDTVLSLISATDYYYSVVALPKSPVAILAIRVNQTEAYGGVCVGGRAQPESPTEKDRQR